MSSKILLFRAPSDNDSKNADSYEEYLRENGVDAQSVPVLQFQFANLDKLAQKLSTPHAYSGVVFTSPRSVEAVNLCLLDNQESLSPWAELHTYVVGDATGQLVLNKLHLTSRGHESGNAAALGQYIITDDSLNRNKPLLFPCGDIKRDTLPSSLKAAGIPLDPITVYETKVRPDLPSMLQDILNTHTTKPEAMVFFSPSGVSGVFDALSTISIPISNFKLFAIGPSTEEALKSRDLVVAGTATKPNVKSLLESLQNGGISVEKL